MYSGRDCIAGFNETNLVESKEIKLLRHDLFLYYLLSVYIFKKEFCSAVAANVVSYSVRVNKSSGVFSN